MQTSTSLPFTSLVLPSTILGLLINYSFLMTFLVLSKVGSTFIKFYYSFLLFIYPCLLFLTPKLKNK